MSAIASSSSKGSRIASWLRGEPLNVPSHALVTHFPAALLPTSLLLDVVDLLDPSIRLETATAVLLGLGLLGGVVAGATGLLDWIGMLPGPRRSRVTRHALIQVAALVAFAISLGLRLPSAGSPAPGASVVASAVGLGVLLVGSHLGGLLVYRDGMRVRTGAR